MSIQRFLTSFVSLLTLFNVAYGNDRISVPMYADGSQVTRDNTERIELALRSATECRFVDEPLERAITSLGQRHHIETWIDIPAFQDEGVAIDQQVTLTKSSVSLEAVLDLLLDPLGLTFVVQHGVLQITTIARADEIMSTRIYPVGDLAGMNYRAISQVLKNNTSGKWVDIDQEGGSVSPFVRTRSLVIRQTRKVHSEIEGILVALRQSKNMGLTSPPNRPRDPRHFDATERSLKIQPQQQNQPLSVAPVSHPIRMRSAGG